ncbi:OmpA/MotB [Paraglaciecola sp. T6c]|uniref:flagellar protein MotY n=1 Tax=Pseudoalteromonas atlantica (strain T6c / ATCC BAA-1087) TaxID=3042615 RepID=UPI00005C523B|nr:OmpA family protein [Paraglaciecola sp. T6c]ABG39925.1 OmpA/MotB [Paraglaciecola sp. T6c]
MKSILFIVSLTLSGSLSAGLRQYAAKIETSDWQLSQQSRLQCTLAHKIPGYGEAMFTSMASKQLNMEFELDMLRLPKTFGMASVYSVPPRWMPGQMHHAIADMTIRKQYNGDLPEQVAWTMLSELEKGFWPTIYYQDWYNQNDRISVGLNASNFAAPYENFAQCVSNLLPYSFDDIAYTILAYQKNSTELTKYSQRRLNMIGQYLKEDSDMELVLLDGYSDSYGGRDMNKTLSVSRAVEIKNYFSDMGVAPQRIEVTGHGERRHIAPNTNEMSRAKNRRVVIRMAKP